MTREFKELDKVIERLNILFRHSQGYGSAGAYF